MVSNATDYNILLHSLSVTRWTTRVKAADVVFGKIAEVRATLEIQLKDPSITSDTRARICGILERQLSSLNVLFNLNVTKNLVVLLEKLSKEFQTVDITGEYALFSIRHVIRHFEEMRSQEEFNLIFGEAKKPPGAMESSCEGRQRKIPRWMNDGEMMLTQGLNVTFTTNDANIEQMLTLYHLPPLRVNVHSAVCIA